MHPQNLVLVVNLVQRMRVAEQKWATNRNLLFKGRIPKKEATHMATKKAAKKAAKKKKK
jgi:hypothetical protein